MYCFINEYMNGLEMFLLLIVCQLNRFSRFINITEDKCKLNKEMDKTML